MKRAPCRVPGVGCGAWFPVQRSGLTAALFAIGMAGCKDGAAADRTSDSTAVDTVAAPSTLTLPVVGEEVRRGDLVLTVSTTGQIRSEASMRTALTR